MRRRCTRALALIPESPPSRARAIALADAALNSCWANCPAEAMELARNSVAVAEDVGDREVVVIAYDALSAATHTAGDRVGALELNLANLARCGPDMPPERTLMVINGITNDLAALGRVREIPAYAERGVELARSTGLGGTRGSWLGGYWVFSLVLLGRWSEAERLVGDLSDLLAHPDEAGQLAVYWGTALTRQGRYDEARPLIEESRVNLARCRWTEDLAWQVAAVIEFDAAEGRFDHVERRVEDYLASWPGTSDDVVVLVATATQVLADRERDPALGVRADRHTRAVVSAWIHRIDRLASHETPWNELLHRCALAHVADMHGATNPGQWAQLAAGWAALGFRYDEAKARFHHAEALLAGVTGRAPAAKRAASAELGAARRTAAELGAAPLLLRIDDLARRARLALDGAGASGPADAVASTDASSTEYLGLTQRELDVLSLLARGRTNGQIAKELFISTKTASVHVSNIIRKLGVTNRVEAAAHAARRQSEIG